MNGCFHYLIHTYFIHMKKVLAGLSLIGAISLAACNTGQSSHEDHNTKSTTADSAQTATTDDTPLTAVRPQFTTIDTKTAAGIKAITDHYLALKNALAADNDKEAADHGKAMATAIADMDISTLTPEQKELYKENEEDLQEHAEHIGKNAGNIKHQREHFAKMSEDVYALVKAFGGGQALYHDYCPMYNDNKGALWLSETKEISNPYLGKEMPRCGNVEEMIK